MFQRPKKVVAISLRCPALIRGVITMHQFGYKTNVSSPELAKAAVLRYLAIMLGMEHPHGEDLDMHEVFSHNSGATFAPEDTFDPLNLLYAAFQQIYTIDCTYNSLIVTGEWDIDGGLTVKDLQDAMDVLEDEQTHVKYTPSYG